MVALRELSIRSLVESVTARRVSALQLCEEALADVAADNEHIGALTCILRDSARLEAECVDRRVREGAAPGALAGVPIVVKDNIDTVPAICSAGLPSSAAYRPIDDASVVARLREQGAVIIGVAATDCGGFGVVSPRVMNPAHPDRITGGSSGGCAAAVASGWCKAAIGTDTGGSIRIPAACCEVAGFKPSYGRVPTDGVLPLSRSADHVGPLAANVGDLRAVMGVIDLHHHQTCSTIGRRIPRIGFAQSFYADAAAEVRHAAAEAMSRCEALGWEVRAVEIPPPEEILSCHLVLSLAEAACVYLDGEASVESLPQPALDGVRRGSAFKAYEYVRAGVRRRELIDKIERAFQAADFLMLPTMPVSAPTREFAAADRSASNSGLLETLIRYTAAFNQTGHPVVSLPDQSTGFTCSLQIVGPMHSDATLLQWAEAFERGVACPIAQETRHPC
jgi:Asp-tRNA(Asn)/Glu-tRNA(Gln) amidotransferase A subunit family amidase